MRGEPHGGSYRERDMRLSRDQSSRGVTTGTIAGRGVLHRVLH
jgi:hypothetical protein